MSVFDQLFLTFIRLEKPRNGHAVHDEGSETFEKSLSRFKNERITVKFSRKLLMASFPLLTESKFKKIHLAGGGFGTKRYQLQNISQNYLILKKESNYRFYLNIYS
jgi:hypothetical protein